MRWFEMGYDRDTVANRIIEGGPTEQVCEGLERTKFAVAGQHITYCLSRYRERKVYDAQEGAAISLPNSTFFMLQIEYDAPDGARVDARLDIDNRNTVVERSSEYRRRKVERLDPEEAARVRKEIWDQAVAAADEALYVHAQHLGVLLTGINVIELAPDPKVTAAATLPAVA